MTQIQGTCLYDFEAQSFGELSVRAGEKLYILRQDVGDGWCEAKNIIGKCGLVPESYIKIDKSPPSNPPPILDSVYSNFTADKFKVSSIGNAIPSAPPLLNISNTSNIAPASSLLELNDILANQDWDSDWDDDDEDNQYASLPFDNYGSTKQQQNNNNQTAVTSPGNRENRLQTRPSLPTSSIQRSSLDPKNGHNNNAVEMGARRKAPSIGGDNSTVGVGTLKRNLNRFSLFKSGVEPYIMGQSKTRDTISATHYDIEIVYDPHHDAIVYAPLTPDQQYTCHISSPQKESKLKGLKSFIAYQLTCSNTGIRISRRYKHFDWLYERLQEKFTLIAIPPLPGKQVTGRYEEEFIEHRMNQLQMWVNRICRHPVLSQCSVWLHFVRCTDMKQWKDGKRKAEKDPLVGPELFNSVKVPSQPINLDSMESQIEKFAKFIKKLDYTVTSLTNHMADLPKKILFPSTTFFDSILGQCSNIAKSFELDERSDITSMIHGIQSMHEASHINWETYYNKHKNNLMVIQDILFEYKGFLAEFPHILNNHRSAFTKVKELQKSLESGGKNFICNSNLEHLISNPTATDLQNINKRMDVISYLTLAEMNYFRNECATDFRNLIKLILQTLLDYYTEITNHISTAIQIFDKS